MFEWVRENWFWLLLIFGPVTGMFDGDDEENKAEDTSTEVVIEETVDTVKEMAGNIETAAREAYAEFKDGQEEEKTFTPEGGTDTIDQYNDENRYGDDKDKW